MIIHKYRRCDAHGSFELEIHVSTSQPVDLGQDSIRDAAYKAEALLEDAVMTAVMAADPDARQARESNRQQLTALFPAGYVEEIPNGYCSSWCFKHLPWFVITTAKGRFKIGCRKRVIHIEWTDCPGTKTAMELFPDENVTRYDRVIHAWDLATAKQYVDTVLA